MNFDSEYVESQAIDESLKDFGYYSPADSNENVHLYTNQNTVRNFIYIARNGKDEVVAWFITPYPEYFKRTTSK